MAELDKFHEGKILRYCPIKKTVVDCPSTSSASSSGVSSLGKNRHIHHISDPDPDPGSDQDILKVTKKFGKLLAKVPKIPINVFKIDDFRT